jgi:hypothetical protein
LRGINAARWGELVATLDENVAVHLLVIVVVAAQLRAEGVVRGDDERVGAPVVKSDHVEHNVWGIRRNLPARRDTDRATLARMDVG